MAKRTSPNTTSPPPAGPVDAPPRRLRPVFRSFLWVCAVALCLAVVGLLLVPVGSMGRMAFGLVPPPTTAPGSLVSPSPEALDTPTPDTPVPWDPCAPPPGWIPYVVQAGDTLSVLAQQHGVAVQDLIQANCLTSFMVYVGQTIYVPAGELPVSSPTTIVLPTLASTLTATSTPAAQRAPLPAGAAAKFNLPPEVINIVLLGSDTRVQGKAGRTDTIILVSINTASKTVGMLSIPRDLWVYIPTQGYDRINTANVWGNLSRYPGGGAALVKDTIEYNFGVPVHYYATIDFKGFIKLIDTLGGVTIAVDCPFPDLELEPGIRHMDGQWALAYARSRITSNDFARSRRQQQVLRALWDQVLRPETIAQIPFLWNTFQESIETDLPLDQLMRLAQLGMQLNTRQIQSLYIDYEGGSVKSWVTPNGAQVLLPQSGPIRQIVNQLFAPPPVWELIPDKVEIRNAGCTRFQAKELAQVRLYYMGFENVQLGPDQSEVRPRTIIVTYTRDPEIIAWLQQAFGVADEDVWYQEQENAPLAALVLLGRNFNPCQQ
ncbi:MAG: LCP family protein [Chloroflexi bacterium]|nr:LCP family protein [Chloroflexota bacterium]